MSLQIASGLLRSKWLIHKGYAQEHLPLVAAMLTGQGKWERTEKQSGVYKKNERTGEVMMSVLVWNEAAGMFERSYYDGFRNAPEGSLAHIPVMGPIMKHEGDCGEPGHSSFAQWINEAAANPRIKGIVIDIDSPGGQANGTKAVVDAMRNAGKPVIGFINNGMAASAAAWYMAGCDEIYASQSTDEFGSIGTYCTIYDFSGFFEDKGIKVHEIYAPQSTLKNADYKDAIEGNYARVMADLKFLTDEFIASVKEGRGDRVKNATKDAWKGEMFFAQDAIDNGLIDGIKTFDEVIARTYEMADAMAATAKTGEGTTKNNHIMFGKNKYPKLSALEGKETISAEELKEVNAELAANNISAVIFDSKESYDALEARFNTLTETEEKLTAANTAVSDAEASLATAQAEVANLTEQLATANAEVTRLGELVPNGGKKIAKKEGDDFAGQTPTYMNPEHSHNKIAQDAIDKAKANASVAE